MPRYNPYTKQRELDVARSVTPEVASPFFACPFGSEMGARENALKRLFSLRMTKKSSDGGGGNA